MLYSADALREVQSVKEQIGRTITRGALEIAMRDGRELVTDEDVRAAAAMACLGGLTPMDDDIEDNLDDPEYKPPVDRSPEVCTGILTLIVVVAFFFMACWLADHLGGPVP